MEPIIAIYSYKDLFIVFLLLIIYSFVFWQIGINYGIKETRKTLKESTNKHNNINV